jgi:vacuolar-type H+-ATPase subunit I/STV1
MLVIDEVLKQLILLFGIIGFLMFTLHLTTPSNYLTYANNVGNMAKGENVFCS